ncbi:MAG: hypothetical protein M3159_07600, partial [Actinomycetota bacterium]|nr:hypothetical protein [Actinomycetota bacterium]
MTVVVDRPARPKAPGPSPSPARRLWDAPVWAHLLALTAVLLVLLPVIGTSSSFLADEGAAIIQAHSLSAGRGWVVEHPAPELDPTGHNYPITHAESGLKGQAPLGKHPVYPVLLAVADRLGGVTGMVLLSIFGTVAAAGLGAALAGRLGTNLSRLTVWVIGLASPLFFDSFLVIGHTIGAALATGAVLFALIAIERRNVSAALAVAPFVAGAVLFRNEAIIFAVALAVVAGVFALRTRPRWPAVIVAIGALGATGAARVGEKVWIAGFVGRSTRAAALPVPVATDNLAKGRVDGFLLTWFTPSYWGSPVLVLSLLAMVAAIAVGAVLVRRAPQRRGDILAAAAVAAGASIVAFLADASNVVPGLLVAFPLAAAGLFALRLDIFRAPGTFLAGGVFALFAGGVIATQYSIGGSGEWGGRYFALGIPVLVPVLILALRRAGRVLDAPTVRWAVAALAVCSVAMSAMAVMSLRSSHESKIRLVAKIERAAAGTGAARPVIVTTSDAMPRVAWPTFDGNRWLVTTLSDLPSLRERLARAGV